MSGLDLANESGTTKSGDDSTDKARATNSITKNESESLIQKGSLITNPDGRETNNKRHMEASTSHSQHTNRPAKIQKTRNFQSHESHGFKLDVNGVRVEATNTEFTIKFATSVSKQNPSAQSFNDPIPNPQAKRPKKNRGRASAAKKKARGTAIADRAFQGRERKRAAKAAQMDRLENQGAPSDTLAGTYHSTNFQAPPPLTSQPSNSSSSESALDGTIEKETNNDLIVDISPANNIELQNAGALKSHSILGQQSIEGQVRDNQGVGSKRKADQVSKGTPPKALHPNILDRNTAAQSLPSLEIIGAKMSTEPSHGTSQLEIPQAPYQASAPYQTSAPAKRVEKRQVEYGDPFTETVNNQASISDKPLVLFQPDTNPSMGISEQPFGQRKLESKLQHGKEFDPQFYNSHSRLINLGITIPNEIQFTAGASPSIPKPQLGIKYPSQFIGANNPPYRPLHTEATPYITHKRQVKQSFKKLFWCSEPSTPRTPDNQKFDREVDTRYTPSRQVVIPRTQSTSINSPAILIETPFIDINGPATASTAETKRSNSPPNVRNSVPNPDLAGSLKTSANPDPTGLERHSGQKANPDLAGPSKLSRHNTKSNPTEVSNLSLPKRNPALFNPSILRQLSKQPLNIRQTDFGPTKQAFRGVSTPTKTNTAKLKDLKFDSALIQLSSSPETDEQPGNGLSKEGFMHFDFLLFGNQQSTAPEWMSDDTIGCMTRIIGCPSNVRMVAPCVINDETTFENLTKRNLGRDNPQYDTWIVPISSQNHWTVTAIVIETRTIYEYNSIAGRSYISHRKYVENMCEVLEPGAIWSSLRVECEDQNDSTSSGLCVIRHIDAILAGLTQRREVVPIFGIVPDYVRFIYALKYRTHNIEFKDELDGDLKIFFRIYKHNILKGAELIQRRIALYKKKCPNLLTPDGQKFVGDIEFEMISASNPQNYLNHLDISFEDFISVGDTLFLSDYLEKSGMSSLTPAQYTELPSSPFPVLSRLGAIVKKEKEPTKRLCRLLF